MQLVLGTWKRAKKWLEEEFYGQKVFRVKKEFASIDEKGTELQSWKVVNQRQEIRY